MNKVLILTCVAPFFLVLSYAAEEGKAKTGQLKVDSYYTYAKKLWKKKKAGVTYFGEKGKTKYYHQLLSYQYYLTSSSQLSSGITYSKSEMARGSEGGSVKADKTSGITSLSLGWATQFLPMTKLQLNPWVSFSLPINRGQSAVYKDSPDIFIAPNDGAMAIQLGLATSYNATSWLVVNFGLDYKKRFSDPSDQVSIDETLIFSCLYKLKLKIGHNYETTLGGYDIGTAAFADQIARRSGGNSKVKAFSMVKSRYHGVMMGLDYELNQMFTFDIMFHRKLSGRNTDSSKTFKVGLGFSH